jgi:nucleoside 2-deoxyribosyltransferase
VDWPQIAQADALRLTAMASAFLLTEVEGRRMKCEGCGIFHRKNIWHCPVCEKPLTGGVVFVTGISGTGSGDKMGKVMAAAHANGHDHQVRYHDVGNVMKGLARSVDPDVVWGRVLDTDPVALRYLRANALQNIKRDYADYPDYLHLIDIHLTFRWHPYTTPGLMPHELELFRPYVRCFIHMIGDLARIQEALDARGWGKRDIHQLLLWREQEQFLTDVYASMCERVDSYAVAAAEPATTFEKLIWHPDMRKVYLARPMGNIIHDEQAKKEIRAFRDKLREFAIVFDPEACGDFDEAEARQEMLDRRDEIGKVTVFRDKRFIDQADALVVYFPKVVPSPGVDAEMAHAKKIGTPIYLYSPEDLGVSPFIVPPDMRRKSSGEFLEMLRHEFASPVKGQKQRRAG